MLMHNLLTICVDHVFCEKKVYALYFKCVIYQIQQIVVCIPCIIIALPL